MNQDGDSSSSSNDGGTNRNSSLMAMLPPPPKVTSSSSAAASATTTAASSFSSERKMNDTTMPLPRYSGTKNGSNSCNSSSNSSTSTSSVVVKNPRVANTNTTNTMTTNTKTGPRFGLHDWKRLLASTKDLAQLKGEPIRKGIPLDEIRMHNKTHDGWIILRGKVYNIGPYLPYHPGGVSIFKNILGKDGTSMFDKYHRWVNIDGLIGPLLIGTAAPSSTMSQLKEFTVIPPKESHLNNGPRVPLQQVTSPSSALLLSTNNSQSDDDDDVDEDEVESILPPPPAT